MTFEPQKLLTALFHTAVAAADPENVLPGYLEKLLVARRADHTKGDIIVIGAGKAAAAMAATLEKHWRGEKLKGLVVTAYGHNVACQHIEVIEAAHPVPDENSEIAARRMLDLVGGLDKNDLVICLLSGGGSSLLALPSPGLTLLDKQKINRALLHSGADIREINCVRKHLSAVKGGRLAEACFPATMMTFAISDVPGDDPTVIASGPTVPDPTTRHQALAILQNYQLQNYQMAVSDNVAEWLASAESETPKSACESSLFQIIATARQSLLAAAERAEALGVKALILGDDLGGEARALAQSHVELIHKIIERGEPVNAPCLLLSGGETTVKVRGHGRGGRNTEYLLGLASQLRGHPNVYALAADTDGIDGSGDNAGAVLIPDYWKKAENLGLNAEKMLENNDSYHYFEALDGLLNTGPTYTNVNDFRAILILPE